MPTAKQLLIAQMSDAFSGRVDMSLLASLKEITPDEWSWRPDETVPTIEQIVRHIAWAKSRFCHEGFGTAMPIEDAAVNETGDTADLPWEFPCGAAWGCSDYSGIDGAVSLLNQSQKILTDCLESCTDESLDQPISTHHGKSAAHFFSVMIVHDVYHAGQIKTRRTLRAFIARGL